MKNGWRLTRLGDVLKSVSRPVTLRPENTYSLVGAHWYAKGLYVKERKGGAEIQARTLFQIKEGDFVYNRLFAWKGSFAVASKEVDDCFVSNEFPCFTAGGGVDLVFLWHYFSRANAWDEALGLSSGSTPTSRNRLKEEQFLNIEVRLPSLDEQRRIVSRIEELSAKAEEAKSLREDAIKQTGDLLSSKRAEIFKETVAKGTSRLDVAATLERGKFSHRPRNDPRFFGGVHPWIQIAEIESAKKFIRAWTETLNDEGLAISRKFPSGTVLVSIAATIGAVGILDFDCCIPDSIVAVTPKHDTNSEFIFHYFGYVRSHLEDVAPQSAQKNINLRILSGLAFPAVPLIEQRRIVAYLDSLHAKVDSLKRLQSETAAQLDALTPSIRSRAFRGEL